MRKQEELVPLLYSVIQILPANKTRYNQSIAVQLGFPSLKGAGGAFSTILLHFDLGFLWHTCIDGTHGKLAISLCVCHHQDLATEIQDDFPCHLSSIPPYPKSKYVTEMWKMGKMNPKIWHQHVSTPLKSKQFVKNGIEKLKLDFVSSSLSNVPTLWATGLPWRTEAVADAAPVHLRGTVLRLWTMNHGSTYLHLFVGRPWYPWYSLRFEKFKLNIPLCCVSQRFAMFVDPEMKPPWKLPGWPAGWSLTGAVQQHQVYICYFKAPSEEVYNRYQQTWTWLKYLEIRYFA